ncbi:MAG: hypothetical protein K1060chlam1_01477 [Candidatus Anoxychlamydiales bacterium]|nr:hypothetical protein [Candidatus Anoxychlamydiales bacterium]
MKKNNFLYKALFSVAAILFATSAIAIPKDPCAPKDVCCDEATPGPFAFAYPKDNGLSCPRGFNVYGEFLWMKPSEEGLEYAISNHTTAANPWIFPILVGKVESFSSGSQEWDWRPGFRIGFGSNSTFDKYQIEASWTYIKIKATANATINGAGDFLPLFLPAIVPQGGVTFSLKDASTKWSGDFNSFDISCSKPYHVSRYYVSSPRFGVRTAWIDQDMVYRYSLISEFSTDLSARAIAKNDYWGVGLLGAYNSQFIISKNWNIYAKALVSLLFGKFDISQHANWTTIGSAPTAHSYDVEDSFYSVQPNAELGVGLCWTRTFDHDQYLASVKVGYEFHHWWNQNQIRRFFDTDPTANDTVSRGDLSFNGFEFAVNIDF